MRTDNLKIGPANENEIKDYNQLFEKKSAEDILTWAAEKFSGKIIFASSFGAEDMVVIDLIDKYQLPINVITLDTGRLPQETYDLIEMTKKKYNIPIKVYYPKTDAVEKLASEKGLFSFRESVDNRKECCQIRKIEPLQRALEGKEAWITGIRKNQSVTRTIAQKIEFDEANGILKINPLLDWSEEMVWNYLQERKVPYNILHDQGYPSIGCQPCTRAIGKGEDIRAGRWWWEDPEQKECGLHGYCKVAKK